MGRSYRSMETPETELVGMKLASTWAEIAGYSRRVGISINMDVDTTNLPEAYQMLGESGFQYPQMLNGP